MQKRGIIIKLFLNNKHIDASFRNLGSGRTVMPISESFVYIYQR